MKLIAITLITLIMTVLTLIGEKAPCQTYQPQYYNTPYGERAYNPIIDAPRPSEYGYTEPVPVQPINPYPNDPYVIQQERQNQQMNSFGTSY